MDRRNFLQSLTGAGLTAKIGGAASQVGTGIANEGNRSPQSLPLARMLQPLLRFTARQAAEADISKLLQLLPSGVKTWRLRADLSSGNPSGERNSAFIPFDSQFGEYRFQSPWLHYNGTAAPALAKGASAARLQIESTSTRFDDPSTVLLPDVAWIVVDTPLARIKHGLDSWSSFDALTRAVGGTAAAGSAPNGRTDLIGQTFDLTPGMFSEGHQSPIGAPVAVLQFPCTLRAANPAARPVLRSISGRRDIVQIEAQQLPPIAGEVVLQDLVIRDNRAWYDSGEAGVRIKDRFAGRSVRIERCELLRCQNAVAGGSLGQTLKIHDCRIIDCGFGEQAHGVYVQAEWLEFFGNLVTHSAGNRLVRAHLLKSRALNARILGNRFDFNDCPGSYLIDLPNGGDVEIGGNLLHYGRQSDNSSATLIAYAAEGARGDHGGRTPLFAPGREFRLVVRNNTMVSYFPGRSQFVVVDRHLGPRAEGGQVSTWPQTLVIEDNTMYQQGAGALFLRRDRSGLKAQDADGSSQFPNNSWMSSRRQAAAELPGPATNTAGAYNGRRFTGGGLLGTGSKPHRFQTRGSF